MKHKYCPDPFFIEMSQQTEINWLTLCFFESKVLHCPLAMNLILRANLEKHKVQHVCDVAKDKMILALLDKLEFNCYIENVIFATVKI